MRGREGREDSAYLPNGLLLNNRPLLWLLMLKRTDVGEEHEIINENNAQSQYQREEHIFVNIGR